MKACRPLLLLAGLAVALATAGARSGEPQQGKRPKEPPSPGQVEVRFANGSIVVMELLQKEIEIQTEYGKLTVPVKDVRQIDFGLHPTEPERRKIEDALGRLASKAYREREAAVRELVALGRYAHLRLDRVARGDDQEAAKRAEAALQQIRQKVAPRLLRQREDDVIRAAKFTIVGRITTPTLKAKAEEFGDLELRIGRLHALRALEDGTNKQLTVDAAKHGGQVPLWLDTGVRVGPSQGLKVAAKGQVDLWPQQPGRYLATPDGQGGAGAAMQGIARINGRAVVLGGGGGGSGGELLGRIGPSGTPFVVGSNYTKTPKGSGKLYLCIAPSPWGCPSAGQYEVTVTTGVFGDEEADDE